VILLHSSRPYIDRLDLILVSVVKGALEIEGDGDVTDNDREREPSQKFRKGDHETSLPWANRSTLHPTPPLALDSQQSRTSIRGDVDHDSQSLRSFLEGVEREPR
jgi:hypothetical protein